MILFVFYLLNLFPIDFQILKRKFKNFQIVPKTLNSIEVEGERFTSHQNLPLCSVFDTFDMLYRQVFLVVGAIAQYPPVQSDLTYLNIGDSVLPV